MKLYSGLLDIRSSSPRKREKSIRVSAVNLTLSCMDPEAVIPAKAEIQPTDTGFRVTPGMTNKGKKFLNHYIR